MPVARTSQAGIVEHFGVTIVVQREAADRLDQHKTGLGTTASKWDRQIRLLYLCDRFKSVTSIDGTISRRQNITISANTAFPSLRELIAGGALSG